MYTHAGNALLALVADGIHLLWRWSKSGSNLSGQVKEFDQNGLYMSPLCTIS